MKKIILAVLLCLSMIIISACTQPEPEAPVVPEPDPSTETPVDPELPNPMQEISELNLDEQLGFSINGWPESYSFDNAYIIAGSVAEIDFKSEGNAVAFRVAKEKEGDISGVYDEFSSNETADIKDVSVDIKYTSDQTGLATWIKDGYVFTLYMKSGSSAEAMTEIAENIITNVSIGPWTEK